MSDPMTPEEKAWIDNASYENLLYRWRFSPSGDKMFIGESGKYYAEVLTDKRNADSEHHTAISKGIGWKKH